MGHTSLYFHETSVKSEIGKLFQGKVKWEITSIASIKEFPWWNALWLTEVLLESIITSLQFAGEAGIMHNRAVSKP